MTTAAELVHDDEDETLTVGRHFVVTAEGLEIIGEPTYRSCGIMWRKLHTARRGIQFAIGDAAKYIRERFGEKADQILSDVTGWTPETLRTYEWTSDKIPKSRRRMDVLEYAHHQAVARLAPPEQKKWLAKAADDDDERWTVARLKQAVKKSSDEPVKMWVLVVYCDSERKRNSLETEMTGRGLVCKVGEKRGGDR